MPGGLVRLGETIRQATQRETREECGVEIESDEVIDVRDNIVFDGTGRIRFHFVVIYLLARYMGGEAQPVSTGRPRRDQIIHGMIAHNSYHACEIITIRHMLGLWLERT